MFINDLYYFIYFRRQQKNKFLLQICSQKDKSSLFYLSLVVKKTILFWQLALCLP